MLKIYLLNTRQSQKLNKEYLLSLMSPIRKEKALKYKDINAFYNCCLAELLIKKACGFENEAQLSYGFGKSGKPYLENGMFFNISHSGNFIACAVSHDVETGIDIQIHKSNTNIQNIAKKFFHTNEQKIILDIQDTESRNKAFFDMWAAKESVVKCNGCGINNLFTSFFLVSTDNGFETEFDQKKYTVLSFDLEKELSLSVAAEKQPFIITKNHIEIKRLCLNEIL